MALAKCPKCELNYLKNDQKYCDICMRDMIKEKEKDNTDSMEICIECSENIAMPGSDYCVMCLREKYKLEYPDDHEEHSDDDILLKVSAANVEDIEILEIETPEHLPGIEEDLDDEDRGLTEDDEDDLDESLERLAEEEDDISDDEDEWE